MKRILAIILLMWAVAGCAQQQERPQEPITDELTSPDIPFVSVQEGHEIYKYNYDNMDRGKHDYYQHALVVDPHHYKKNALQRGDVVFYDSPEVAHAETFAIPEKSISRIVALPGERISIRNGQVLINGRRLDTFYGMAHRLGSHLDELRDSVKKDNLEDHIYQNIMNIIEYLESIHMDEMVVPENHVFLIGDDWFRSLDSQVFGPLPEEFIRGKVLGYVNS
ncbi:signal peptidase I [Paenibacillus senegalensis]|uniref:signal peptidase I n=1 Tax=Paenibacillus senegalensis TaxID=1465766 RepID=UPI000289C615|nr:signal peptidase I [Paenibacillus senegalensis]